MRIFPWLQKSADVDRPMDSVVDIPLRDGEIDLILARKYVRKGVSFMIKCNSKKKELVMLTRLILFRRCIISGLDIPHSFNRSIGNEFSSHFV